MDEMMRGQRGWRELAILGDKLNKFSGIIEGLIWSPRGSDAKESINDWAFEEVGALRKLKNFNISCLVWFTLMAFVCITRFLLIISLLD